MEKTSLLQRHILMRLSLLGSLEICLVAAGCGVLDRFSHVERDASRYGTVAVGAVRAVDYNAPSLRESRRRLSQDLDGIRASLNTIYGVRPQVSAGKLPKDANADAQAQDKRAEGATPAAGPNPQVCEMDLIASRMSALKFIESERADTNLAETVPLQPGSRRMEVSLDCSAWVRGNARAVLVEIDLYPFKADSWCHQAGQILKKWAAQKPADGNDYAKQWDKTLGRLEGFYADDATEADVQRFRQHLKVPRRTAAMQEPNKPLGYYVARCHDWLEVNHLRPLIVHIERMSRAEYQILGESNRFSTEAELGLTYAVASAKLGSATEKLLSEQMARMQSLNLAFVAGYHRAGWLFMPAEITSDHMPPTERRLKMVVDVPDDLLRLGIHIHKLFLDDRLRILGDSTLARQVAGYQEARSLLDDAERLYPDESNDGNGGDEKSYRFVKTRMRNMLYQGWPEEIVVDIPRSPRTDAKNP